jgi:hypothetical protein
MRRSILIALFALAGCSSAFGGRGHEVTVHTPGAGSANCILTDEDGRTYNVTSPGTIVVEKGSEDLHVHCRKQGYRDSVGYTGGEHKTDVYMQRKDEKFISFLPSMETARWVGQGSADSCGLNWAADVRLVGDRVSGSVWRNQVEFLVAGRIDPGGQLVNMPAARSTASFGRPGPQFIRVNLYFSIKEASGSYSIDESGQLLCTTQMVLKRSSV